MYIKINNESYSCTRRITRGDDIVFLGVSPEPPEADTIELYRDDGFLLRTDDVSSYLRRVYQGSTLTYTNTEEPQPTEPSMEEVRNKKVTEISDICSNIITAGFDLDFNGKTEHFNLTVEDQSNISNLFRVVELGGTEFPYQADGGACRVYSAQEIAQIYIAAQTLITTQTTYHNALKRYVLSLEDIDSICEVQYGMDLPEPYATEMTEKLAVAQAQMNAIVERLCGAS